MKKRSIDVFLYVLSLMPFWVLYGISNGMYYLLFYIIRYRREVVLHNLKNSFPEKSVMERNQITKKFYRFFLDLVVESILLRIMSAVNVLIRIDLLYSDVENRHIESQNG